MSRADLWNTNVYINGKYEHKKRDTHYNIRMIPLTTPIENIHRYLNMYMEIFYMNIMVLFLSKTCKIFLSVTKLTLSNARQIIYAPEAKKIPHE